MDELSRGGKIEEVPVTCRGNKDSIEDFSEVLAKVVLSFPFEKVQGRSLLA